MIDAFMIHSVSGQKLLLLKEKMVRKQLFEVFKKNIIPSKQRPNLYEYDV